MINIAFISGIYDKRFEQDIISKSKTLLHYADNNYQELFIHSLSKIDGVNLSILSSPFVPSFPKESRILFSKKSASSIGNNKVVMLPFMNLWGIKNIFRYFSLKSEIKKISRSKSIDYLFVYSVHFPFLKAAAFAKKKNPNLEIVLIVPDLPNYTNLKENRNALYSFLKNIDIKNMDKLMKKIDGYILLTEAMWSEIKNKKKPFVVIEGIVNDEISTNITAIKNENEYYKVVYTGNLNYSFGVKDLVDAFDFINEKYIELIICGSGEAEKYIIDKSSKDSRIKFLGQVSNSESKKIQLDATILVNPRNNKSAFTKYSFPSKTLEYLITGNIVLGYKLDGIPSEYDKYIKYIQGNSPFDIALSIKEIIKMSAVQRYEYGKKAKQFVISNKGFLGTSSKISQLLKEMRSKKNA